MRLRTATDRPQVIEELRERMRGLEGGRRWADDGPTGVPTGLSELDGLLGGGLRRGTLVEWIGDSAGCGAATLALAVAAQMLRSGGAFVVIDPAGEFYPVAAAQLGIPLDRTAVVRPDAPAPALWAWEQALRCPGVGVTCGQLDVLDDRVFRRLQLAVEEGGGLGFVLRRPGRQAAAGWGATCIRVQPLPTPNDESPLCRRFRLRLNRGAKSNDTVEVELNHEASAVHLVSELADPTALREAAAGSGAGPARAGERQDAGDRVLPERPAARRRARHAAG